LVTFFQACKPDLENTFSEQLKGIPLDWASGVVNCDTTNCIEYNCFCWQANCCNRQDLDPCDFDNMGLYAIAVAQELCKATTNCLQKSFPLGCVRQPSVCYDFSFLQSGLFTEDPDANPFLYCSNADCGTYYCDGIGAPFLHRPMTIALQDQIAARILWLQSLLRPQCDSTQFGPNCSARLGDIFFSVCTDPEKSGCENLEDPCWDTKIIIRFEYYCCPCCF
jgi:hypothetical protein